MSAASLRSSRAAASLALVAALLFLGVLLIYPFGRLVVDVRADSIRAVFGEHYYLRRLLWTIGQGGIAALAAGVLGLPTAWWLRAMPFPAGLNWLRSLLLRGLLLPFLIPTVVAALAILSLVGPNGWLPLMRETEGFWLLLWGYLFYNLGLVVWMCWLALGRVPAQAVAAARSLGASPWRVWWRVIWPLIRPAWLGSVALVFLFCATSFGVALMLGGSHYATLEVEIYSLTALQLDLQTASVLAVTQLLVCGLIVVWHARAEKQLALPAGGARWTWTMSQPMRYVAAVWLAGVSLLVFGPLLALLRGSLSASDGAWAAYRGLAADPEFWQSIGNTLRFTGLGLPVAGATGATLAIGLVRRAGAWRLVGYLPYLVSGSVLSLALLLCYPAWSAQLAMLIGAYCLLAYPFVTRNLLLALQQLSPRPLEAARTLGANPWRAWCRAVWPLLWPALRTGLAFAAASILGEFAVTLFLSRPEWSTLSTLIYQRLGRPGVANLHQAQAASVLLLLLALGLFSLLAPKDRHADPA